MGVALSSAYSFESNNKDDDALLKDMLQHDLSSNIVISKCLIPGNRK